MIEGIRWLGHASFRITAGKVIYVDPWKVASRALEADLVLVTHGHYDHLSKEDIDRVRASRTVVVIPASCANTFGLEAVTMRPGDRRTVAGVDIQAVPAYNVGKKFHPRENGWLGYVLHLEKGSVYVAGDTDLIPEMAEIKVDVALLPVGGTYTMTAEEAVEAAVRVGARVAVPMHWGDVVGGQADAERFCTLAKARGIDARILDPER